MASPELRVAPLLILAAVLSATAPAPCASAAEPQIIASVNVITDDPMDTAPVVEVLGLVVGRPLDRQLLREGVHAFYAGGEVEYLRVDSEPSPQGHHLTVHLRLRSRIRQLDVVGTGVLRKRMVEGWLELQPNDPVTAAQVESGAARVLRELKARGYADATVEPSLDYHRPSNTVDLTVTIDRGEPRELSGLRLEGLDDPAEADGALPKIKAGKRVNRRLLDRVRDETEANLRQLGYWEGVVTSVQSIAEGPLVELVVQVSPGPRYRVQLHVPPGTEEIVLEAIPDPAEEEIHPAQTEVLAERLRENLQLEGHLLATARVVLVPGIEEHTLEVHATPGVVRDITEVRFPGAEALSAKILRRSIRAKAGRTEGWRGRPTTTGTLARDRAALESVYRRHGFADAVVAPAIIEADGPTGATVSFAVTEGIPWTVSGLRLEGFPVETVAVLEDADLPLAETRPWQPGLVDEEVRLLETALANTGYPRGSVAAAVSTPDPGHKQVVFTANPGPYVTIGKVVIAGLAKTKKSVVERTLVRARLITGEAYSKETILRAQRLLYELGLFRRVEIVPLPGQEHRADHGLVVACDEGSVRSYLVGVGWDNVEHARLSLGWTHLNLFGGAHAVSLEATISGRLLRYQASLRESWLPHIRMPGYLALYRTTEEFATYSQKREGIWTEVGDRRVRPFRHWYRLEYQAVEPDAPDDVLSDLEREEQRIKVASFTPNVEWDLRDDPFNPRRGWFASASLEYAFPALQAEAQFLKAQTSFSFYRPVRSGGLAVGLRLGAIQPLGEDTGEPENLQVPLGTRFFAGGRVSHRAFKTDMLGIPDQTLDEDGQPMGGNAMVLLNVELRRPIWGALSAAIFVDGGNVWASPSLVRAGDIRWGVGLGVRYDTPAGPLRLEYGHKLDQLEGESSGEIYLSFGVPF